ncbi:hypothetical protein [Bacillus norwichensis]|uniref:Uncharacterized protein n=1 Tax=Bacillus norwichensis TaxID=2762217 RepID=A0ABR8VNI2_9BACI|nr:hypothetical protein [Bacillus norwichensis]MBD8006331.1 hypothetical protein [Bacillus norwichensis]
MKPLKPLNITYLISSWVSISMIFIIGEVVTRFGVFSSLVIVSAFLLAFAVFFALQRSSLRINKNSFLGRCITIIRFLEIYILHLFICGLIFHTAFQVNMYFSVFATAFILMICAVYLPKGKKFRQSIKDTRFILISGLAILLPTYIYLQKGLESLYHNLLYYQPQVLNHDSRSLWLLFLIAFIIFFSKLLLQREVIDKYNSPSIYKVVFKLLMAVFIYCTFILAFATMNVVAITQNLDYSQTNELFILLVEKLSLSVIFKFFCIVLYFSSLIILIDALPPILNEKKENRFFNGSFVFILIAACLTVLIFFHYSLLSIYVFFGCLISLLVMIAIIIQMMRNLKARMSI